MLGPMGGCSAMQFAILLTVLSGCDVVWGLVREDAAVVDAAPIDTPTGCDPLEHDEDNDMIPDRCDNCPAVANNPQGADQDMDGVGDVCDPQIDQFSPEELRPASRPSRSRRIC
jgi:Thrombospondin type 3 repeat